MKKLSTFTVKIGYPDKWKDYSQLQVKSYAEGGSFFQNVVQANRWNLEEDLRKLDKEVDRSEWFISPQVVNACSIRYTTKLFSPRLSFNLHSTISRLTRR
ncbi:MAG: hypothetical protein IPK76_23170 [Lewinellaceae bacterium]|nr:hypothetical protein [Lewinellaceae bacterium]